MGAAGSAARTPQQGDRSHSGGEVALEVEPLAAVAAPVVVAVAIAAVAAAVANAVDGSLDMQEVQ